MYPEDAIDYLMDSVASVQSSSSAQSSGLVSLHVSVPTIGRFKVVAIIPGTTVSSGASSRFDIGPPSTSAVALDQMSYFPGHQIVMTLDVSVVNY